jgi:5-methyltetrahydropteroyltriglutamate--homocysteine methyltransferase
MRTHNLGYPRFGSRRELKNACKNCRADKISLDELLLTGKQISVETRNLQLYAGIDFIPGNVFLCYDPRPDACLMLGRIPLRILPQVRVNRKSGLQTVKKWFYV